MKTEDIYSIFRCDSCGQEWQAAKCMRETARRHAASNNHNVSGITVNEAKFQHENGVKNAD